MDAAVCEATPTLECFLKSELGVASQTPRELLIDVATIDPVEALSIHRIYANRKKYSIEDFSLLCSHPIKENELRSLIERYYQQLGMSVSNIRIGGIEFCSRGGEKGFVTLSTNFPEYLTGELRYRTIITVGKL